MKTNLASVAACLLSTLVLADIGVTTRVNSTVALCDSPHPSTTSLNACNAEASIVSHILESVECSYFDDCGIEDYYDDDYDFDNDDYDIGDYGDEYDEYDMGDMQEPMHASHTTSSSFDKTKELESDIRQLKALQEHRGSLSDSVLEEGQIALMNKYRELVELQTQDLTEEEYKIGWQPQVLQQIGTLRQVLADNRFSKNFRNTAEQNLELYQQLEERPRKGARYQVI